MDCERLAEIGSCIVRLHSAERRPNPLSRPLIGKSVTATNGSPCAGPVATGKVKHDITNHTRGSYLPTFRNGLFPTDLWSHAIPINNSSSFHKHHVTCVSDEIAGPFPLVDADCHRRCLRRYRNQPPLHDPRVFLRRTWRAADA